MDEFSDDVRDKIQAVFSHCRPDPDDELGQYYQRACAAWYRALSEREKAIAERVIEVDIAGYEYGAAGVASQLPPAPRFPRRVDAHTSSHYRPS